MLPPSVLQCCTLELWHAALAALERWQQAGSTDWQEGYAQLFLAQLLMAAERQQAERCGSGHSVQFAAFRTKQPSRSSTGRCRRRCVQQGWSTAASSLQR